jgi:rfaE bifunctional protein kinase chain/domain
MRGMMGQEQSGLAGLRAILGRMAGRRVLVLGDMLADEYIIGRPSRLSREAPIPVLEWVDRYIVPGGATNLARNCRALGAEVAVCGVIGDDESGRALAARLAEEGIATDGLTIEAGRPTATATRVIGGGTQIVSQQIARIDRVVRAPIAPETQERLGTYLARVMAGFDALVVSDYEHGTIAPAIIAAALPLARGGGLTITVDAHGDLDRFVGITVATPNQDEAAASLGRALDGDGMVCAAGQELARRMDARGVLITRGSEGMTLAARDGGCHHLPAVARAVRDATGAGDTVSATVTLALAAGGDLLAAARLGNLAAGVVVRHLGAATITSDALRDAIGAAGADE